MNILDKIVNAKKLRLDELKKNASLDEIKQKATSLENKPSSFRDSCLLYTSPSPRDLSTSRMPSSA